MCYFLNVVTLLPLELDFLAGNDFHFVFADHFSSDLDLGLLFHLFSLILDTLYRDNADIFVGERTLRVFGLLFGTEAAAVIFGSGVG